MIASMTGFGRGTAHVDAITATVELRSVNNRYLDLKLRVPQLLTEREVAMQQLLKDAFERGRISVQVQVERADEHVLPIEVDEEATVAYKQLLEQLCAVAGVEAPVRLEHLLQFSDVFDSREELPEDDGQTWAAVQAALAEAIDELREMRATEGAALEADLRARLQTIETSLNAVEERAPERVKEAHRQLHERLDALLAERDLDADRLAQEAAVLTDKLDITEECVRLHSHLTLFRDALSSGKPVGRKLNFITQEIHREVNTIGSKANDAAITERAVAMKEAVEKIREQVQNVE